MVELTDILEKFEDCDNFERKKGQSINENVAVFDFRYRKINNKSLILPSEILAFRLIKRANITREEMLFSLTCLNSEDRASLYEQVLNR